ncbi:MAG: elongation factor P maturation arginine rhamnosyltransferase EarP [Rhodocyclaceae bacterium]|nr:elongation factor P maturation arginine rhamnosyltransferase EarP [Rhodocyclaceae bacterium]
MEDRWDIFCRVIDNFGDIGVTWRLARQLAAEYDIQARLWVDDLESFRHLNPDLDPGLPCQSSHGVEVCRWSDDFPPTATVADVVIEAFACELPPSYLAAMAARAATGAAPVWINLEYLSAEAWVESCHGMASPHPTLPLTKHFFFPGFTCNTGGLLREKDLLVRRDSIRPARPGAAEKRELEVFLFCYDNPALPGLLEAWRQSEQPIRLRIPPGAALTRAAPGLAEGRSCQQGSLLIDALPFVPQEQFDTQLWRSDVNFVRGEDSMVRALWAGRPLVWQIYPQANQAHLPKLEAFLDLAGAGLAADAQAQRDFWLAWNNALPDPDWPALWRALDAALPALDQWAAAWSGRLAIDDDLATRLVNFRKKK